MGITKAITLLFVSALATLAAVQLTPVNPATLKASFRLRMDKTAYRIPATLNSVKSFAPTMAVFSMPGPSLSPHVISPASTLVGAIAVLDWLLTGGGLALGEAASGVAGLAGWAFALAGAGEGGAFFVTEVLTPSALGICVGRGRKNAVQSSLTTGSSTHTRGWFLLLAILIVTSKRSDGRPAPLEADSR